MREAEWLACTDPVQMLEYLKGISSGRRLRLFACACYRRFHEHFGLDDPIEGLFAIEMAEAYVDGHANHANLTEVRKETVAHLWDQYSAAVVRYDIANVATAVPLPDVTPVANAFVFWVESNLDPDEAKEEIRQEHAAMCDVLRDLYGNPFQPVTLDPAWLSWNDGSVVSFAERLYEEKAYDRLPILGDALEDAGCREPQILTHCREERDHVPGCWVLDLLLGKESPRD